MKGLLIMWTMYYLWILYKSWFILDNLKIVGGQMILSIINQMTIFSIILPVESTELTSTIKIM